MSKRITLWQFQPICAEIFVKLFVKLSQGNSFAHEKRTVYLLVIILSWRTMLWIKPWLTHVFEPTCATCTMGSYASLSVRLSICLWLDHISSKVWHTPRGKISFRTIKVHWGQGHTNTKDICRWAHINVKCADSWSLTEVRVGSKVFLSPYGNDWGDTQKHSCQLV